LGILEKITAAGFKIVALKYTQLSLEMRKNFMVYIESSFLCELVDVYDHETIVSAILEKENAVKI